MKKEYKKTETVQVKIFGEEQETNEKVSQNIKNYLSFRMIDTSVTIVTTKQT